MTRKEAVRQTEQANQLMALGFTEKEAEQLRRISMTLHRWYERECGSDLSCIVRPRWDRKRQELDYDDEGPAYEEYAGSSGPSRYYRVPDRETGAKRRLRAILDRRNGAVLTLGQPIDAANPPLIRAYIQTDPRGAALYLLRPGDVPDGGRDDSYYSRGICVY